MDRLMNEWKCMDIKMDWLTYCCGRMSILLRIITWQMREREMFYLTTPSTHFIYGYMASDIWLRTILIVRNETRCRHIGYSYQLTARVLLYAPSQRQDNTYHGLWYTSHGALAGTRKIDRWLQYDNGQLNRSDEGGMKTLMHFLHRC